MEDLTLTREWLARFGWPDTLRTGHPLAIAHRGARAYAPENTEKAFRIAADLCAEMWELDVFLSADGVCVVSHDANLAQTAGRDMEIADHRWRDLSAVALPEGQRLLRLEDAIALARECGCGLYVEIKGEGAARAAWKVLEAADFRFACIGSFVVDWIADLRAAGCDWPLSVLVPQHADPLDWAGAADPDIVHICWRNTGDSPQHLLTDDLLDRLSGRQVVLWDEDRPETVDALLSKPVMGICSDRPEMLKPYRPDPVRPVAIVCHRGANDLAPENTLEAARICLDQKFQYVELDVRTTSDGELVVMHDPGLERTTDGSGLVIDADLGLVRGLNAGGWFREGSRQHSVPTLDEYLELVRGRAGLYVEVKHADGQQLLDTIRAHDMLDDCFFWSFDTDLLRWMRRQSADIILMATRWKYDSLAQTVADYGAQIVEFDATRDDLSEIGQCAGLGVRSMLFSVATGWEDMAACLAHAPDMVNLDQPGKFKIVASYPLVRRHFRAMLRGNEQDQT